MLTQSFRALSRIVLGLYLVVILFAVSPAPTSAQLAETSQITTVLLVRHADRGNGDFLTLEGKVRAKKLVHVLEKADVKAIFVTNRERSLQTAQPLIEKFQPQLEATTYKYGQDDLGRPISYEESAQDLKDKVLLNYAGQVVFAVAHLPTIYPIVQAFGGNPDNCQLSDGNEYDNLCVISVYAPDKANVINLQYGKPSPECR